MVKETDDWQIDRWLKQRDITQDKYNNLTNRDKATLLNTLQGNFTSVNQRRQLYKNLYVFSEGRKAIDVVQLIPEDELKRFFTLTTEESLSDLEKY